RAARRKAKGKGVPRPQNCYLLYRGYHHPIIVAQNPGIHNNEVSVIIGKMWRELPEGAKKYWKEKAQAVKLQHEKDHPGYVYQPRKPSQIRSRTKKIK
ncbi:mating-type protein Mat a-1, partial [Saccharata proteae CBS 121410]